MNHWKLTVILFVILVGCKKAEPTPEQKSQAEAAATAAAETLAVDRVATLQRYMDLLVEDRRRGDLQQFDRNREAFEEELQRLRRNDQIDKRQWANVSLFRALLPTHRALMETRGESRDERRQSADSLAQSANLSDRGSASTP